MPYVYDAAGRVGLVENAVPVCGTDFCDGCGDCLACYGSDPCPDGVHAWYLYADELEEFLRRHEGARFAKERGSSRG